jgi:CRP-like cAMP-binding protein/Fe-S-cluster-containing hydrogenase component 2
MTTDSIATEPERVRPSRELAERIAKLELFADVDEQLLRRGLDRCWVWRCPSGTTVVEEGDFDTRFFVLLEGSCAVFVKATRDRDAMATLLRDDSSEIDAHESSIRPVAELQSSGFFGELTCMSPWPRSSTVVTDSDALLVEVGVDVFEEWMQGADGFRAIMEEAYMSRGVLTLLRRMEAFGHQDDRTLKQLAEGATTQVYRKGDCVFTQGDPADAFYLIRGGTVAIRRKVGEVDKTTAYLRAGSSFGEMALLEGTKRTATVTAASQVELIRIDRDRALVVLAEHAGAAEKMRQIVQRRREVTKVVLGNDAIAEALTFMVEEGIVDSPDLLVVDLNRCMRCGNCEAACEAKHGAPLISLHGPTHQNHLFPTACRQCHDPLCLMKCPVDAIHRDATGEVVLDEHCIGCGRCQLNCPYGTITLLPTSLADGERARQRAGCKRAVTHQAVKCDLCKAIGSDPQCVRNCPTASIVLVSPNDLLRPLSKGR